MSLLTSATTDTFFEALITEESSTDFASALPLTTTILEPSSSSVDIGRLVLIVASFIIGFLGIVGNGLVVLVCIRYPLRGVTNILVCNQSIIDLLSSIVFVLRYGVFNDVQLPHGEVSADFVCKVWISEYPLWALAVASTLNLIYLTLERYVAVFHPITYRQNFTSLIAKVVALVPWIIGFLHELPWGMAHSVREDGGCSHQWWTDRIGFIIGIIVPINHYILPLAIMGFVYGRILLKLQASGALTSKGNKGSRTDRASRNVIKTMFMVSFTYLVCWGPNEILYFYANMGGYVDWGGVFYFYTVVSALCNMCVNPFIYAFHYQDFRLKLGKLLAMFCPQICSCCPCYKDSKSRECQGDNSVSNISSRV